MELFPAIDILDGQAVRLLRGNRDDVTVYGSPIDMAEKWANEGAKWLHVVDLNGAFDNVSENRPLIREIVDRTGLCVQVGGGIRSEETIKSYLDAGVTRVILGTAVFENPSLLRDAVDRFGGERVVCGMDARDGKLAIKGWVATVDKTPVRLGIEMKEIGVRTVVYTDITRDGALSGLNVGSCKKLMNETGLDVIASGGLKDLNDVRAVKQAGLYGAILGKALYEKKFTLPSAYLAAKEGLC